MDKDIVLSDMEEGVKSLPEDELDEGFQSLPEDELEEGLESLSEDELDEGIQCLPLDEDSLPGEQVPSLDGHEALVPIPNVKPSPSKPRKKRRTKPVKSCNGFKRL